MKLFVALFFFGALVAVAVAHGAGEDDEEEDFPKNVPVTTPPTTTTTRRPMPRNNYVLSLARPPIWTFRKGSYGPRTWGKWYPKCRQLNQSPINIQRKKVISSVLKPVKFTNFVVPLAGAQVQNLWRYGIINFCHTKKRPYITGGPLPGGVRYYLGAAYFVVGKNKTSGSSTRMENKKAPFEISFVFHSNPNVTVETHDEGSEVILTFLGKISKKNIDNPNYAPVVKGLKKVTKGGQTTYIKPLKSLRSLFPRKTWELNYYTYTGSSKVPPCTEGRIRIIYQRPIVLSKKQLKAVRGLYNEKNKYIWNNYRHTQNNTFVQVFSSVEKVPKRKTTKRPNVITTTTEPY